MDPMTLLQIASSSSLTGSPLPYYQPSALNRIPTILPGVPDWSQVMTLSGQMLALLTTLFVPRAGAAGTGAGASNPFSPNHNANGSQAVFDNKGDQGSAKGNVGEWSQEDQALLDKAISGGGTIGDPSTYDKIFSQFGQSSEGNCASVAVIKGALDKFDGKVFSEVRKSGDGYDIKMQDGKSVHVSGAELKEAAKQSKFKGKPHEAKSMGILMFAAMAKRGSQEGMGSFSNALRDLCNGFSTKKAAKLLGLGNRIKDIKPSEAKGQDGVVAYSGSHAVYIDQGKTDHYGTAKAFNNTDTNGRGLVGAFVFA